MTSTNGVTFIDHPRDLGAARLRLINAPIIAVDTETTGLDPFVDDTILLVQIATPTHAYVFDARKVDVRNLAMILENPKTLKIGQNLKFDYKMLKQQCDITLTNVFDTMLAERVLTSGLTRENGLSALAAKYLDMHLSKDTRETFHGDPARIGPTEAQLRYSARDVLALFPIYEAQRGQLEAHKLSHVAQLEFDCLPAVAEMELAGLLLDTTAWQSIVDDAQAAKTAHEATMRALLAACKLDLTDDFNLNSNVQLKEVLRCIGIELPNTLEGTLAGVHHPLIDILLDYRGAEKTVSAFGEKFFDLINPKTGRIHPEFNQLGADTGRFSSSKPNVQQIPHEARFRDCFVAREGYKIVTCDYSQAELRILCQLSGDEGFIHAFRGGLDLHQLTASQMYGVPFEEVTKNLRGYAKFINFGLAYGRGPAAVGAQIGVSTEEAKGLIKQYFNAYPGIEKWLNWAGNAAVTKGYSVTTFGRKRFYAPLDPRDPDTRRMAAAIDRQGRNSPIQGGNADMTKLALIGIHRHLATYDARLVNTVHDEIVVEVREGQAEIVKSIVEREMVHAGMKIIQIVPVVAEAAIADRWSK